MMMQSYKQKENPQFERIMRYINMGFTGMFSIETVMKIIGFGVKVRITYTKTGNIKFTYNAIFFLLEIYIII